MLKEALDWLAGLVVASEETEQVELDGRVYVDKALKLPPPEPLAAALGLSTLGSLVRYVADNRDGIELGKTLLHVEGPTKVAFLGPLTGRHRQREVLACAIARTVELRLGAFLSREAFQIQLQYGFVAGDGDHDALLRVVGNVEAGTLRSVVDDGVGQEVTVKKSAVSKEREAVPRVVRLSPFRTFAEVVQPQSSFIFRLRDDEAAGISCGLFEADGGAWRLTAVAGIGEFLESALTEEISEDAARPAVVW